MDSANANIDEYLICIINGSLNQNIGCDFIIFKKAKDLQEYFLYRFDKLITSIKETHNINLYRYLGELENEKKVISNTFYHIFEKIKDHDYDIIKLQTALNESINELELVFFGGELDNYWADPIDSENSEDLNKYLLELDCLEPILKISPNKVFTNDDQMYLLTYEGDEKYLELFGEDGFKRKFINNRVEFWLS
jgi:hypothetical protein